MVYHILWVYILYYNSIRFCERYLLCLCYCVLCCVLLYILVYYIYICTCGIYTLVFISIYGILANNTITSYVCIIVIVVLVQNNWYSYYIYTTVFVTLFISCKLYICMYGNTVYELKGAEMLFCY